MAEPTGWEPQAGVCTISFDQTTYRSTYSTTNCAEPHKYETVHIGQFTGDSAALPKPPASGSTAIGAAWAECDAKTTEYLGGQWRDARIAIAVSVPSPGNWEGGARWFRCGIAPTRTQFGDHTSWPKSLKGELAQASPLKLACFQIAEQGGEYWPELACTEPHNGEYAGSYPSNDTYEGVSDDNNRQAIHRKCLSVIAGYVGVPDDGNMRFRSGSGYWYPSEDDWAAGDRFVRCYLYLNKKITQSLKGGGTKALPIS
jgi:Septum formation